jgi:hypothetical protein
MIVGDSPKWVCLRLYNEISLVFEYSLKDSQLPPLIRVIIRLSKHDGAVHANESRQVHAPRLQQHIVA